MTATAAAMLATARHALGGEPDELVQAQIERLAEHVDALNAFPLPDETPPYFPAPRPLPDTLPPANLSRGQALAPATGPLHTLSAFEIARLVASRAVSAEEVAIATLDRIAATDASLQAWVYVNRDDVLAQAKKLDAMQGAAWPRGPLHGVPIGVKDIYDVAGMPTRAGSRVLAGAPPATKDSWLVARLRAAGALIVGKTATTEFASADPAGTRNPWNLAHTPGGSSSGSAAAVAARVVPLALGSQTAGSVIRPASFCGIVGFKPTWGRVPLEGVIPFAWSLDTAGWFARSVEDAELVWRAIGGERVARHFSEHESPTMALVPEPFTGFTIASFTPNERYKALLTWHRSRHHLESDPSMKQMIQNSWWKIEQKLTQRDQLRLNLPSASVALDVQQIIMASEASQYHGPRYLSQRENFGPRIGFMIAAGLTLPGSGYLRAQRVRSWVASSVLAVQRDSTGDIWLTAAAAGGAPEGLDSTGDPSFNAPWTQFGFPAITLFGGVDPQGPPLGVQLVGRPGHDGELLATAAWCENVLGAAPAPPGYVV